MMDSVDQLEPSNICLHRSMSAHTLLEKPDYLGALGSLRHACCEPITEECSWHVLHNAECRHMLHYYMTVKAG